MIVEPPLTTPRARALGMFVALGLVLAACTSTGATTAPSASGAAASGAPAVSPSASAAASPTAPASPSPSPKITQTDTAWGRIWDAVPSSFPIPAGASPVSPDRPASAAWSLASGDPAAVADALKSGLEGLGFTTAGVDGPLEDGSRIIDSVGKPDACRVQTRVRPLGTTVSITILFGAACPFR